MVSKLSEILSGLFIPDPDPDLLPIPDPGVKKAPDPGSGIPDPVSRNCICIKVKSRYLWRFTMEPRRLAVG
jgi:hypothetical protein